MGAITENPAIVAKATTMVGSSCEEYPIEINTLFPDDIFCNWKRYNQNGTVLISSLTTSENYLFRGNNLPVLQALFPSFKEKIKLIYIDPPYNTGSSDFAYKDRLNHTDWLKFIKPRLELAMHLLHREGAIFIQIDDREMPYLKVLCDDIFGRQNFKECIALKTSSESGVNAINVLRGEQLFRVKEYLLYYTKSSKDHRFNPLYIKALSYNKNYRFEVRKKGNTYHITNAYKMLSQELFGQDNLRGITARQKRFFHAALEEYCLEHSEHIYSLETNIRKSGERFKTFAFLNKTKGIVEEYLTSDNRIILVYNGGMLTPLKDRIVIENGTKHYGTLVSDFWWDIGSTPATEGGVILKSKKPEKLLKRIINLCTMPGDIVLDFFLGSGTTAATSMKMKRRFIGIEELNYGSNDSLQRLSNVIAGDETGISRHTDISWTGGGSFVYAELKTNNK